MPSSTARRISGSSSVEVRARNDWWTVASSWSWRSRGWSGGGAGISPPAVTTARRAAATAARLAPSLPASGRHDPQAERPRGGGGTDSGARDQLVLGGDVALQLRHHLAGEQPQARLGEDRKSTRLNSSHGYISYAVFCLKKKKKNRWCTH